MKAPSIGARSSHSAPLILALAAALATAVSAPARAQTYEIVGSFTLPPGSAQAELCEWNGDLYGTSATGGDFDQGTVYKVTPSGDLTVLHSFGGAGREAGGYYPAGGLVFVPGTSGGFYGTTRLGGAHEQGTVFRMAPGEPPQVVYSFGGPDGAGPQSTLVLASDGYVYGATSYGGGQDFGTLFRFQPKAGDLVVETFHSFVADRVWRSDIATGPDGLYVAAYRSAGGYVSGAVYKITTGATPRAELFKEIGWVGTPGSVSIGYPWGVAATTRALYVTTGLSVAWGTVLRIALDTRDTALVCTFSGGDEGATPESSLFKESEMEVGGVTITRFLGTANGGGKNRLGTAFRIDVQESSTGFTSTFQKLADFGLSQAGSSAITSLTRGPEGTAYGVTGSYALGDRGAVYRLGAHGIELVAAFGVPSPGLVGWSPAGLAWDTHDNLLGVTWRGGDGGEGAQLSLDPTAADGPRVVAPFQGGVASTGGYELSASRPVRASDGSFYSTLRQGGSFNKGAIVRLALDGSPLETVYSFTGGAADGEGPQELVPGPDDRLYGVAMSRSGSPYGTAFAYDPGSGAVERLWTFANPNDGPPTGALVVDAAGDVYGVTDGGTLYRLHYDGSAWRYSVQRMVGWRPYAGLMLAHDGFLYGTTGGYSATQGGTLFRVKRDGTSFENLHSFSGDMDGCTPAATLIEAPDGWLYGTTSGGYFCQLKPGWWGSIFRVNPVTRAFEVVHTFDRWNGGSPSAPLLAAPDGSLYGTATVGGPRGGGVVFRFAFAEADAGGPYTVDEGGSVTLSATCNQTGATFAWDLDVDGSFETAGASVTFSAVGMDGPATRSVRVRATYGDGLWVEDAAVVTIANETPSVDPGRDVSLIVSEALVRTGTFVDRGADTWTATVDYGDGSGSRPLAVDDHAFSLNHAYATAGTFTVTVTVIDDDGALGTGLVHVAVATVDNSIEGLIAQVRALVAEGQLNDGQGTSFITKLEAALQQLEKGHVVPAINELEAFVSEVSAYIESGNLEESEGRTLIVTANRVIAVLNAP